MLADILYPATFHRLKLELVSGTGKIGPGNKQRADWSLFPHTHLLFAVRRHKEEIYLDVQATPVTAEARATRSDGEAAHV